MKAPPENWRELMNPQFMFNKADLLRHLPASAAGASMIAAQGVGELVLVQLLARAEEYATAR